MKKNRYCELLRLNYYRTMKEIANTVNSSVEFYFEVFGNALTKKICTAIDILNAYLRVESSSSKKYMADCFHRFVLKTKESERREEELRATIERCDEQIKEAFATNNRFLYECAMRDRANADKAITTIREMEALA